MKLVDSPRQFSLIVTACVIMLPYIEVARTQDPPPATSAIGESPEVETFIREGLKDRLLAGDIPDIRLVRPVIKMGCCERAAEFSQPDGVWRFRRWFQEGRCS